MEGRSGGGSGGEVVGRIMKRVKEEKDDEGLWCLSCFLMECISVRKE